MSTKKEKCCECTSKERPSHVFRSSGTPGMKDGGYFTCNCPCHQSESIELAEEIAGKVTDIIFNREAGWSGVLELYLSEKLSQAITTAVVKREKEIAEEVEKLKIGDCSCKSAKDSCQICGGVYCKIFKNETIENVLSLLKH